MKGKANFLIFCTIFVASGVFGQQISSVKYTKRVDTLLNTRSCWGSKFSKYYKKDVKDSLGDHKINPPFSLLPGNYYSANLGFFCKQEIKLEKATKIPFKFRLGSVQECDRMEGKVNTSFKRQ